MTWPQRATPVAAAICSGTRQSYESRIGRSKPWSSRILGVKELSSPSLRSLAKAPWATGIWSQGLKSGRIAAQSGCHGAPQATALLRGTGGRAAAGPVRTRRARRDRQRYGQAFSSRPRACLRFSEALVIVPFLFKSPSSQQDQRYYGQRQQEKRRRDTGTFFT